MLPSSLLTILALPLLALAQQQGNQSQPQPQANQTIITSTVISIFPTLGPDRQASTSTRTFVFTTTQPLSSAPQPTGNGTAGNSTTPAGNTTQSVSTTTTHSNLPTAPTNVDGGGLNGAPMPGQTGVGGIFGPDDKYIAAATSLKHNAFVVGFVGFALGGAMLAL